MNDATGDDAPQILVVEDDWLIAAATARALQRLGYRTLGPASSVTDAMELLDAHTPSAALVDTVLSRESGLPVADRLLAAGVPFAFYSGYALSDLPERFAACRLIAKPVTEGALKAAVAELAMAAPRA